MGASASSIEVAEGVSRLTTTRVPESDVDFWRGLLTKAATQEDVFSAIRPDDVRKIAREQPENLFCLFRKLMFVLNRATADVAVPGIVAAGVGAQAGSGTAGGAAAGEAETEHGGVSEEALLQCMRILTRFMPFLHELVVVGEATDETVSKLHKFFWKPYAVVGDDSESLCFAEALIDVAVKLFFVPGFNVSRECAGAFAEASRANSAAATVEAKTERKKAGGAVAEPKEEAGEGSGAISPSLADGLDKLVWCSGAMVRREAGDGPVNARHNSNRVETIKLLLTLECSTLYQAPTSFDASANPWLAATTRVFKAKKGDAASVISTQCHFMLQ